MTKRITYSVKSTDWIKLPKGKMISMVGVYRTGDQYSDSYGNSSGTFVYRFFENIRAGGKNQGAGVGWSVGVRIGEGSMSINGENISYPAPRIDPITPIQVQLVDGKMQFTKSPVGTLNFVLEYEPKILSL